MSPDSILRHYDDGMLWPAEARAIPMHDVAAAYRDALAVRALRIARGERPVGYKIGFTNRTIWERYQVFAPIWGTVWDTTLTRCDGYGTIDLAHTCQPRLEPEVAFGIASTPPDDATLEQLFACIDWLAPSFEVVQAHQADWKFSAAETIADGGLHARLLVGRTTSATAFASGEALDARLAATTLQLSRADEIVDRGRGANVLDGPLHALLHLVRELARRQDGPRLLPGDIVTTGTWTDAWPVEAGQRWRATFDAPFPPLDILLR